MDEDVHPPEARRDRSHRGQVRDVDDVGLDPAAGHEGRELPGRPLSAGGIPAEERDLSPAPEELERRRAPDPGVRPGHEAPLSVEADVELSRDELPRVPAEAGPVEREHDGRVEDPHAPRSYPSRPLAR